MKNITLRVVQDSKVVGYVASNKIFNNGALFFEDLDEHITGARGVFPSCAVDGVLEYDLYSGLNDSNEMPIFENDLVMLLGHAQYVFRVVFMDGAFRTRYVNNPGDTKSGVADNLPVMLGKHTSVYQVIGNTHENKDLTSL